MPIRFVDRVSRIGRISATLDAMTATMLGAVTSPANRTGVISAQLEPLTAEISGFFTPAISRTGTIAATLESLTATLTGTHTAIGLSWIGGNDTTTDVNATVGTPVDLDVAAQVVGEQSIALVSGSVPGLTYNPGTMRITGTPTTANEPTGANLVFDADDGQGGGSAAADWAARINQSGVVWHHNFDSAAEVNRFLWSSGYGGGNDPNRSGAGAQYVTHQPSGGADGGGFMRLTYPLGSASGRGGSYWWRPFNAFTGATNGRGANDPGANGAHSPVAWNVTDGGSTVRTWTLNASNPAFFGPAASMAANPTKYYGTDFYVQLRVRRAQTPGPPPDAPPFSYITGKSAWFNITLDTSTANEIVVYGQSAGEDSVGQQPRLRMYEGRNRSGGPGMGGSSETDTISNDDGVGDWRYSGGWDTLLYHITPGTRNGTGSNRTRVEVWAAHPGETSYTKIWDVLYSAAYETSPNTLNSPAYDGWNALILAIYHNGSTFTTEAFNFDYDQVIFSKETIACPQV